MQTTLTEKYLRDIQTIWATADASAEVSFYSALHGLLSGVGESLDPRVIYVAQPKGQDDSRPDGGLYAPDQLVDVRGQDLASLLSSQRPEHGVVEVKGFKDPVEGIARSRQVQRYWERYQQVLVTNYREFLLVGRDNNGDMVVLEQYSLAESELAFWNLVQHPRAAAKTHEQGLIAYLKRVMLRSAPLTTPEQVASALAAYARRGKERLEASGAPLALTGIQLPPIYFLAPEA